ncbi:hypothetical protein ACFQV2_12775 [Actinokineospora soli]|uniref:Uncharacterized protein n=1 Tax=Actinokineospora soli TaxID=1048753 RepID=A0ABW2TLM9_9PSEU
MDVVIAGQPIRITIDASEGWERKVRAAIHRAEREEDLADDTALRPLAEAVGLGEMEQVIGDFMLDFLRMDRTQVWQGSGGADGEGAPQMHGWTSYFGALYLNPGGEKLLLGDVNGVGLPGKLLELFVDLPYSTVMAELAVAEKRETKTASQIKRRADDDAEARTKQRAAWQQKLRQTEEHIAKLRQADGLDVSSLMRAVDETGHALREAQDESDRLEHALHAARSARVRAVQAKQDATETWQARRVLGRLDPTCCPRCEEPLTPDRRQHERATAACAVCTRPLPQIEPELAEALIEQLDDDIIRARGAENTLFTSHREARAHVAERYGEHEQARKHLQETLTAEHPLVRLHALELSAAELRGGSRPRSRVHKSSPRISR